MGIRAEQCRIRGPWLMHAWAALGVMLLACPRFLTTSPYVALEPGLSGTLGPACVALGVLALPALDGLWEWGRWRLAFAPPVAFLVVELCIGMPLWLGGASHASAIGGPSVLERLFQAVAFVSWAASAKLAFPADARRRKTAVPMLANMASSLLLSMSAHLLPWALSVETDLLAINVVGPLLTLAWAVPVVWSIARGGSSDQAGRLLLACTCGVAVAGTIRSLLSRIGLWASLVSEGLAASGGHAREVVAALFLGSVALALLAGGLMRRSAGSGGDASERPESEVRRVLANAPGYEQLSPREASALDGMLAGATAVEAASRAGIRPSTVETYRRRALTKLGIESKDELIRLVLDSSAEGTGRADDAPSGEAERHFTVRFTVSVLVAVLALSVARLVGGALAAAVGVCALGIVVLVLGTVLLDRSSAADARPQMTWLWEALALATSLALVGTSSGWMCVCGLALVACTMALVVRCRAHDLAEASFASVVSGVTLLLLASRDFRAELFFLCAVVAAASLAATLALDSRRNRLNRGSVAARLLAMTDDGSSRTASYLRGRGLSTCEAAVAELTAFGLSLPAIAGSLSISRHTASAYRSNAYRTLGVADRAELVAVLKRDAGFANVSVSSRKIREP